MDNKVPYAKLKKAYIQAANIVSLHGEKYLPIFERLEKEYQERKQRLDALDRAMQISQSDKNIDLN